MRKLFYRARHADRAPLWRTIAAVLRGPCPECGRIGDHLPGCTAAGGRAAEFWDFPAPRWTPPREKSAARLQAEAAILRRRPAWISADLERSTAELLARASMILDTRPLLAVAL